MHHRTCTAGRGRSARTVWLVMLLAIMPAAWADEGPLRCEVNLHESGIEPFGWVVTYRANQKIKLPDFLLQTGARTDHKLEFQVRTANGTERTLMADISKAPLEFELDGRHYIMETAHTVLHDRALASNELVVWPRDEYRTQHAKQAASRQDNRL